jgi:hypothetical protein
MAWRIAASASAKRAWSSARGEVTQLAVMTVAQAMANRVWRWRSARIEGRRMDEIAWKKHHHSASARPRFWVLMHAFPAIGV